MVPRAVVVSSAAPDAIRARVFLTLWCYTCQVQAVSMEPEIHYELVILLEL